LARWPAQLAASAFNQLGQFANSSETGANSFFRRRFLVRVSCKSVTGFVWYQIPAPIRTLFYFKPESGVHLTEMMAYDWIGR